VAVLTLIAAAVLALAGCYEPQLASCTVACERATDCATGQRCSDDGFCVGDEIASSCEDVLDPPDARPIDGAQSTGDAAATATVRVVVEGVGKIRLLPIDLECRAQTSSGATCLYVVGIDAALEAEARDHMMWRFASWTSPSCPDAHDPTCDFVASAGVTQVSATFVDDDD
jgi:hypothetical protein